MDDGRSVHARHEARFGERGYRRSTARACPRVVAGKRCRADGNCLCDTYHRVLDHARIWLAGDRDYVLTAEPYHADGHDLVAFLLDLQYLGLDACISGTSPWNPGATFLITIRRNDSGEAA